TIAGSRSCTITVNVTGTTAGLKSNTTGTISATESGPGATSNTATVTVVAPPTASKAFGAGTIVFGQTTTLSFTITNPNTASALSGIAFTDSIPAGLKLASNVVTGTCGAGTVTATIKNPPGVPSTVSLSGGTLTAAPGPTSSCTFSVNVTGISGGVQNNTTSTIGSTEGGTSPPATASITVNKADTTTAVTSSTNPPVFGQNVTFTATPTPNPPGHGTPTDS